MKKAAILFLLALVVYTSCKKNDVVQDNPPVIHDSTAHVSINKNDIIGWWRTSENIYHTPGGGNLFESVDKYFGPDSFYYQLDGYSQGTTTGKWWWGANDSLHVIFDDGYQRVFGQNPFYPTTIPRLDPDSMYFHWSGGSITYRYKRLDSTLITSSPIYIVAGNGDADSTGNEGPATEAGLNYPLFVAVDDAGNFYITDNGNNCIRKVTADGIIHKIAGKNKIIGAPGDGIPAIESYVGDPAGLAIDKDGSIYFCDSHYSCIYKITPDGIIHRIAGQVTVNYSFSGDGGPALQASLGEPWSPTLDAAGNLYFLDFFNRRIRKISADGIITTVAGTGVFGANGDGSPAINAQIDAGSITSDAAGNLYIAGQNRIRKISASTGIIETIAGDGVEERDGENVPAISSRLKNPTYICVDNNGNIYFVEVGTSRIRKISSDGMLTTAGGSGIPGVFGFKLNGKHATAYGLEMPGGTAADRHGNVFVADMFKNRIYKIEN